VCLILVGSSIVIHENYVRWSKVLVLRDRLVRHLVGLNVRRGTTQSWDWRVSSEGLSDELDIVGADVEVLVGEVKADSRGVGSGGTNSTGSGESRRPEMV
jgi:hypothetical protein